MRTVRILFAAAVIALAASMGYHRWRDIGGGDIRIGGDELAWLRKEFTFGEEEWAEVVRLHEEFRPICERMCAEVMAAQSRLDAVLIAADGLTPEVEEALAEFLRVKEECYHAMLRHVYAVAALMTPEQRVRYLQQVSSNLTMRYRDHP